MPTPMKACRDRHGPVQEISSLTIQFNVDLADPTPSSWNPNVPDKETNVKRFSKAMIRKNGNNWSDEQLKQALQVIDGGFKSFDNFKGELCFG